MVSNSRNIPSRGASGGEVTGSSVVGKVAKVRNLRSVISSQRIYMHVHNFMWDTSIVASSGCLHSRIDPVQSGSNMSRYFTDMPEMTDVNPPPRITFGSGHEPLHHRGAMLQSLEVPQTSGVLARNQRSRRATLATVSPQVPDDRYTPRRRP